MVGALSPILVVFHLAQQRYALDLAVVERVLPMVAVSPLPDAPEIALGVINVHGAVVPVLDLGRRVGIAPRNYGVDAHLLLARTKRRRVAIPVDEVVGVRAIAATAVVPASEVLPGTTHVAGIAALPDGLLFIHDLDTLLSSSEEQRLTDALQGATG